jgi:transposase
MTEPQSKGPLQRYIALDIHKHYVMVGGLNAGYEVVLPARRLGISRYADWAAKHLRPTDAVVLEASTNTWVLYDQTVPHAGKVQVAHPYEVKQIANARVKTDKQDVFRLARLLAADLVPTVWVPPIPVRELRSLIAHRRRLLKLHTMTCNRLQSLLHRFNIPRPEGGLYGAKNRPWWQELPLDDTERLRLDQDLAILDLLAEQVAGVDRELHRLSTQEPWQPFMPYLLQLPGFGMRITMTVLSAIGDITRFPTAKHLVGYAGMGSSVHDSGQTYYTGRITKKGRKELRWAMVQAAWSAVRYHSFWKAQFQQLLRRKSKGKAIVAIARRLLVVVWNVMSERAADRRADPDMVGFKLMVWAWKLSQDERGGLTVPQFVRYHLMQLQLGDELTHLQRAQNRPIPSVEELLKLHPELPPLS